MATTPTMGELYKALTLSEDNLLTAIKTYLEDPSKPVILEAGEYRLDVGAAVQAHPWAREMLARETATKVFREGAVRTAVLLARPA
ncbi:hypothetical protein OPKNFCMD_5479 [Methylobacterium crusticola]|uniref:Uncharacterized protein n=1 Tax=Methylobacterium crusticola TaxID=1697972 RepID=A0ABQ4R527_9HYPH|nr:hypothetical protein [Methylobacterium crusticola]GJD52713.1 hypothetical protein OPKNFCMD_5479 [Methylobacterium crusticola]